MSDENAQPATGTRKERTTPLLVTLALGLVAIVFIAPETIWLCGLLFSAIVIVCAWPDRPVRGEKSAPLPRGAVVWPSNDLKAVVSALDAPILVIDRRMVLRFRNAASQKAFGNLPVGEIVTLRFRAPELTAAIARAIAAGEGDAAAMEEGRPVERSWFVDIRPVEIAAGGNPTFFLLVFHDRTQALRVERIRTDFVANASHELRTPLASLTGFIETLQGPARDDPAARDQFLKIMREQAARMARLIDDLLSLSRIEMNRHLPVSQPVDLKAVLEGVLAELSPLWQKYDVVLEKHLPDRPVMVLGDEGQLGQVFSNLLENACKYGGEGGRIVVTIALVREHGEPKVDVVVRDFGPGIAAEHLPRLTERFYRVNVGTSRARQGTGLGLSIVRNILQRHRARLIVESKVGEGSTFTARFPADRKISQES